MTIAEEVADGGKSKEAKRAGRSGLHRYSTSMLVVALLLLPIGLIGGASAASATSPSSVTCAGTSAKPAALPGGTYTSVSVTGLCSVNDGQVVVTGNVTVKSGGALVAAFYHNDVGGSGTSGLTVDGNIDVNSGATLFLGCEAAHFACLDDPNQKSPTLNAAETVKGSIVGHRSSGHRRPCHDHRRGCDPIGWWRRGQLHPVRGLRQVRVSGLQRL